MSFSLKASLIVKVILVLGMLLEPTSGYGWAGNTLRDLEYNDRSFINEVNQWTTTGLSKNWKKWYFCDSFYLAGGYDVLSGFGSGAFFQRTFGGLPSGFNMVYVVLKVYALDNVPAENIVITAGSYQVTVQVLATSAYHYCGNVGSPDNLPYHVHIKTTHASSSFTLRVSSTFTADSKTRSFAFRDVSLTFYLSTSSTASTNCFVSSLANNNPCTCPTPKFYQPVPNSGNCVACDPTCATCNGPLDSNCQSCILGRYLSFGECLLCDVTCFTCSNGNANGCERCYGGDFLTSIHTCVPTCHYPLFQSTNFVTATDECTTPCATGQYLWWDRTCDSICAQTLEPLRPMTYYNHFDLCEHPCLYEEYLYWNTSCIGSCPHPLTKRTKKERLFCDFLCPNPTDILFWDKDCLVGVATCPFPLYLRTEGSPMQRRFCDYYCKDYEFMYWNGTCNTKCEFPFIQRVYKGKQFCDFTCTDITKVVYWDGTCQNDCQLPLTIRPEGGYYLRYSCHWKCKMGEFLYWNGTCAPVCIPPLTYSYTNSRFFCNYPCSVGQYLRWDGVCQSSCPDPLLIRVEDGLYFCDFPCTPSQPYLFWNGTCSAHCDSPFAVTVQGSAYSCNFPCNSVNDILYWDGTCKTQCDPPLTLKEEGNPIRKFCDYGCDKKTEYLYWNKSCLGSCDSPLSAEEEAGLKFCRYPCSTTGTEYLYWDGACMTECDLPLTIRVDESSNQYCDFACDSPTSDYLYWNGTCSPFCMEPLTQEVRGTAENQRHFCHFGCPLLTDHLYWNGTCESVCELPLKSKLEGGRLFCDPPCYSVFQFYYTDTETCRTECVSPYTIDTTLFYARCVPPPVIILPNWFIQNILTPPDHPGALTFTVFNRMMNYARYLDIRMPPRLYNFSVSQGRNFFSARIGWSTEQEFHDSFVQGSLPDVFARNGLHSSFLVNIFPVLTTIVIIILAAVGFSILEKAARIYDLFIWESLFELGRILTRWGALLVLLSVSIEDFMIYSSIQFKTFAETSSSDYTILSLFACLAFLGIYLALIVANIWVVKKSQSKTEPSSLEQPKATFTNSPPQWGDFQIFFQGFKSNYRANNYFYLIYLFRMGIPGFITAFFYGAPVFVSITQVIFSCATILYLILLKPLKHKVNLIQLSLFETIVLVLNICSFILTIQSVSDTPMSNFSIFLGDAIIFGNFCLNVLLVFFLLLKLFHEINNLNLHLKKRPRKGKVLWLRLIALLLQQAGLGFEEIVSPLPFAQSQVHPMRTDEEEAQMAWKKHELFVTQNSEKGEMNQQMTQKTLDESHIAHHLETIENNKDANLDQLMQRQKEIKPNQSFYEKSEEFNEEEEYEYEDEDDME